jgi:pimeloyl-ACP methyl ester carboxylesterase
LRDNSGWQRCWHDAGNHAWRGRDGLLATVDLGERCRGVVLVAAPVALLNRLGPFISILAKASTIAPGAVGVSVTVCITGRAANILAPFGACMRRAITPAAAAFDDVAFAGNPALAIPIDPRRTLIAPGAVIITPILCLPSQRGSENGSL